MTAMLEFTNHQGLAIYKVSLIKSINFIGHTPVYLVTNSTIKGTLWGTLGIGPRFLKGSVKSFYHAKMLVGAY